MTTDGRSEGSMHIRSAMLFAVALSFPGAAVAQMSRAALVKQSDIIFIGTVTQVGLFQDRKSTRLNSSHVKISYAVFCLKKKKKKKIQYIYKNSMISIL